MAKELNFEYDGVKYRLGFSRDTIRQMERQGFDFNQLNIKAVTMTQMLWSGAFLKYHRKTPQKTIDEIWSHLKNRGDTLAALSEMYAEPVNTLVEDLDESEGDTKNFEMDTSW